MRVAPRFVAVPILLALVGSSRGQMPATGPGVATGLDPAHIRAVVVERNETDSGTLQAVRALGANMLVTPFNPDGATASAARQAGLLYVARMTTQDVARAQSDPFYAFQLRSVPDLAGVLYEDDETLEGYTSPQAQQQAYGSLKAFFPGALILHPTRLVPIAWDPTYLDTTFRPEFTDLVTPYFYPVGATVVGTFTEADAWGPQLEQLLGAVAQRMPADKGVLPVLQGFEQIGFPVDRLFLNRQMDVYRRVWPGSESAAVFAWRIAPPEPLIDLADLPQLQQGVCDLFARLAMRPTRCRKTGVVRRIQVP